MNFPGRFKMLSWVVPLGRRFGGTTSRSSADTRERVPPGKIEASFGDIKKDRAATRESHRPARRRMNEPNKGMDTKKTAAFKKDRKVSFDFRLRKLKKRQSPLKKEAGQTFKKI
jgi:hypothetical protein